MLKNASLNSSSVFLRTVSEDHGFVCLVRILFLLTPTHRSICVTDNGTMTLSSASGDLDNVLTRNASQNVEDQLVSDGSLHCGHGALTGALGLFVQALLAFIAFGALIVKRFCEPKPERRPWRIWFFDTSKQAIGAAVIHFANVFLAELFQGDPCTWYFISFLLDSTAGLLIIYIGLTITRVIVIKKGYKSLIFGEYGNPPQCNAWVGQCGLYILVMFIEKILMTFLVLFDFWKMVRRFIMSPINDPKLELVIVMFIVPFIVNAFIFWVVDNFLKKKSWKTAPHSSISSNESAVKYFKAIEKVKYYKQTAQADESDSDMLLSQEEEQEAQFQRNRDVEMSREQDRLLSLHLS